MATYDELRDAIRHIQQASGSGVAADAAHLVGAV
jgi:hypothetical protein